MFRIRSPIDDLTWKHVFICPKILIQRLLPYCALPSQLHKRLVHSDANQPGGEFGISSDIAQVLVSLQERLLNRVLRVFPVTCNALSDSEKCAIVSLHELLESSHIPILAGMDKIEVIICLCSYSELCRLRSHNRSTLFGE